MKIWALLLALALSCPTPASAVLPLGVHRSLSAACTDDGHAGAPSATIEFPTLLNGYVARSLCAVAGVDYPVGLPTGQTLLDPTVQANLPAGFTYTSPNTYIRCDSVDGVVLQGFDFSLHNGIGISNVSCTNLTIQKNKFVVGSNGTIPINQGTSAPGIIVQFNTIDGGGLVGAAGSLAESIYLQATSGLKRVWYNRITNANQHYVSFTGSGAVDLRYNVFDRCGFSQGVHCNGVQFVGGTFDAAVVANNTFISDQPDTALEAGAGGTFSTGSKTITSLTGTTALSVLPGMSITSTKLPAGTMVVSVVASTSITVDKFPLANGVDTLSIPNAYPIGLIIPIRFTSQGGGALTYGRVSGNTIVTKGPIQGVSYAIYCSRLAPATDTNSGAAVYGNYIDPTGVSGGSFYPTDICLTSTFGTPRANIDMTTGLSIPGP